MQSRVHRVRARASGVAVAMLSSLLWVSLSCAPTVRSQSFPGVREGDVPISKVAIVPFGLRGDIVRLGTQNTDTEPETVTKLVARHLAEELMKKGVSVVPADDFRIALERSNLKGVTAERREVANIAAFEFGAKGVIFGEVTRFRERVGRAPGVTQAASVGFSVSLFHAPAAQRVWSGTFEETQQPINENVFNVGRYPGGGTRWLTAEELAIWGTQELAKTIPVGPAHR